MTESFTVGLGSYDSGASLGKSNQMKDDVIVGKGDGFMMKPHP
jgi:hypothetical protein